MTRAQSDAYQLHLPKATGKRWTVYEAIKAESLDGLTCADELDHIAGFRIGRHGIYQRVRRN